MKENFKRELLESGYVHSPLPLHEEKSLHAEQLKKPVLKKRVLWNGETELPQHEGIGEMVREGNTLKVTAPTTRATMPYEDGATRHFFQTSVVFALPGEDWSAYNRVSFRVKPDSDGSHSVHLRVNVKNEGEYPIPDPYWLNCQSSWRCPTSRITL